MFKQEVRVNSQIGTFLERARKEIYNRNLKPDMQGTLFYQPCSFFKAEDFHLVIKFNIPSEIVNKLDFIKMLSNVLTSELLKNDIINITYPGIKVQIKPVFKDMFIINLNI